MKQFSGIATAVFSEFHLIVISAIFAYTRLYEITGTKIYIYIPIYLYIYISIYQYIYISIYLYLYIYISIYLYMFQIEGYSSPFLLDRDSHGIMIYFPDYLPCKRIESFLLPNNVEVMFMEMNIRKTKWPVISGYNPRKENISYFLGYISKGLDKVLNTYENFIILGDFNSQMSEMHMKDFCDLYDLEKFNKRTNVFQKSK